MKLVEAEANIRRQTEQEHAAAVGVWMKGLTYVSRNVDTLHGVPWTDDGTQQRVLIGLLAQALNTQFAAFQLASTGYYAQAAALLRYCLEHMMALHHAHRFPKKASRYLDLKGKKTPDWNEIMQDLQSLPAFDPVIDLWRKDFNPLSHADRMTVQVMWGFADRSRLRAGPCFEGALFDVCALEFGHLLGPLIHMAEGVSEVLGAEPASRGGAVEFNTTVFQPWIKSASPKRFGL